MNGIELIDTGLDPVGRASYLEEVESHFGKRNAKGFCKDIDYMKKGSINIMNVLINELIKE